MLPDPLRFKLNAPHVVAENFEDEVVVINLVKGSYYSIEKSGVPIWQLASAGATVADIETTITQRYAGDPLEMRAALQAFLAKLQQAELIVRDTNGANPLPSSLNPEQAEGNRPFEPPILQEYSDMQQLLLLDPIHEVDAHAYPLHQ